MKVRYLLLISFLIVGALFVPAVSAEIIINESLTDYSDTSHPPSNALTSNPGSYGPDRKPFRHLAFKNIEKQGTLGYVIIESTTYPLGYNSDGQLLPAGRHDITYNLDGVTKPGVVYVSRSYDITGRHTKSRLLFFLNEWDNTGLSGVKYVELSIIIDITNPATSSRNTTSSYPPVTLVWYGYYSSYNPWGFYPVSTYNAYTVSMASSSAWKTDITVDKIDDYPKGYEIFIARTVDDKPYQSTVKFYNNQSVVFQSTALGSSIHDWYPVDDITHIEIINPLNKTYTFTLPSLDGETPTDPGVPPSLRTGTVTMTDNNGTSISGFEVTAVNFYTGQSYNVSTDTDVAVMTLPMDRTISMRNPQTGEYEVVPIGYYKFYGQAPGYKMLNEGGIQVAVVPEEYSSYQLCNILVTSESGPLTGKHMFQIRSRADNTILQTGTISAKSATTGNWYNTTVTDGIATLILPYDTSNSISQYAGNYYVYATSPGYQENDYGTQIVVMPHTVSEIRDILLTPIGGVPAAGNVTLRIQAFSEYGPGVPNASIFIAGVDGAGSSVWDTYTASSTGYLTVSVPGNSTYDIVASGDGYYDSARRITVYTDDPPLIEIKLYLSGTPTVEPTTQPTGWPTTQPTTQPTGGIPDDDDGSEGFLMEAVRGIGLAFGVGFGTAKLIFGMLLALSIGYSTAKQLRGGAAEFGLGLLGGAMLGVLIGLLPVWIMVVLLLIVGMYIGYRYVGGGNNG